MKVEHFVQFPCQKNDATDCRKENDMIKCYGNIHETQEINK